MANNSAVSDNLLYSPYQSALKQDFDPMGMGWCRGKDFLYPATCKSACSLMFRKLNHNIQPWSYICSPGSLHS